MKLKINVQVFKMNQSIFLELRSRVATFRNHEACIFHFALSFCGLQFWRLTFVQ